MLMSASAFRLLGFIFSHKYIVTKGGAVPSPFPLTGNVFFNTNPGHNRNSFLRVSANLSNDVLLYSLKNVHITI